MDAIIKGFYVLVLSMLFLGFVFNILIKRDIHIFGDIYLDKLGYPIHIPFLSALIISALILWYFDFFQGDVHFLIF